MPSRIDIGPEGGPFVAVNENNNDLELQDINGNVIAKWDETAGHWDFANTSLTNLAAVETEEANIGNVVVDQSVAPNLTSHSGNEVTVVGGEFETIFDLTDPTDVVFGKIVGERPGRMRLTWSDDTTNEITASASQGEDRAGNRYQIQMVPPIKNIKKLEFRNNDGADRSFGWEVLTI